MNPQLTYTAQRSHLNDVARAARRGRRPEPRPVTRTADDREIVIRVANDDDFPALTLLAALDSTRTPEGHVLVALVDGQPWAALQVADGTVAADPFQPTVDVVALLRARAELLTRHPVRTHSRRGALRSLARRLA